MSWTTVKLSDLASVQSGGGAPQEADAFSNDGVPFVRAGSLIKLLSGEPESSLELLQPDVAAKHRLKQFPSGTILFAKSGMSATKGHIYELKKPAYVVNHLAALVPHNKADSAFLKHVLNFKSPATLIKDEAYPSIRLGDIENMEVPAPRGLAERERVAGILDQADTLRRTRQLAKKRLTALSLAIFYEMFGSFQEDYESWPVRAIGDYIAEAKVGLVRGAKEMRADAPIPYLRMDSIGTDGNLRTSGLKMVNASQREIQNFSLYPGDLLFNTRNSRELVGKTAVVREPFDGVYNNNILRCRFKDGLTSDFIDRFLRTHKGQEILNSIKSGTTSVFAIYQKSFMNIQVPVPPTDLQKIFSDRNTAVYTQKKHYGHMTKKTDQLFASLQQRAFRGEL